jgi:hypothetical protein
MRAGVLLQLGHITALRGLTVVKLAERTKAILVANVGTNGIYGEAGLRRQWGDLLTTQFTVHHGFMGSLFKIRIVRAGNTIVVPLHVSESYDDWQALLVTLLAPALLNFAISRCAARSRGVRCGGCSGACVRAGQLCDAVPASHFRHMHVRESPQAAAAAPHFRHMHVRGSPQLLLNMQRHTQACALQAGGAAGDVAA